MSSFAPSFFFAPARSARNLPGGPATRLAHAAHLAALAATLAAVVVPVGVAQAQNSAPAQSGRQSESPTGRALAPAQSFEVTGFDLDNPAGLDEQALGRVRAIFEAVRGKGRTVSEITAARLAAQALLDKEPASTTSASATQPAGALAVNIPEQTLVGGRIRVVIERAVLARLGAVQAVAAPGFDEHNVRASLPALQEGAAIDATALDRQLRLGELNPFKRTNVTLGLRADGTPSAVASATAERSDLVYLTADNYGPDGARARLGAGYLNGNLTGRDDVLALNAIAASEPGRMKGLSASYALPFYAAGQMLEVGLAHSESDSAGTVEMFHINGTGSSASLKWSYLLPRLGTANLRLTAGYLYHRARNHITFNSQPDGLSIVPSGATAPLSVGVEGEMRPGALPVVVSGALNLAHNAAGRLGSTDQDGLRVIRESASGDFTLLSARLRADAEFAGGWQLRAGLQGQTTSAALTGIDQLNIAGPYAVRGWRNVGLLGDKAVVTALEAATPVLAQVSGVALRGWSFADYGAMWRNHPAAGDIANAELASAGLGVRATARWGVLEVYLARKLSSSTRVHDTDPSRNSLWLNASVRF